MSVFLKNLSLFAYLQIRQLANKVFSIMEITLLAVSNDPLNEGNASPFKWTSIGNIYMKP